MKKEEYKNLLPDGYTGKLFGKTSAASNRIMVGIPMTGLLRSEWVMARYGQVIPCNWSQTDAIQWLDQYSPIGFLVAEARNLIADAFLSSNYEWLFFIDHDTIIPPGTILRLNERMLKGDVPVWSGLYFTKSVPAEPLVYRGRGSGCFKDWRLGDEVWVDGIPMGCTMIHRSIMKALADEVETYQTGGRTIKRIFETPARTWYDPEMKGWFNGSGTEDLEWCTQIIQRDIFKKAGWPEYADKEFPFLIDTSIFCKHIDWDGNQYPLCGEHLEFTKDGGSGQTDKPICYRS